MTNPSRKVKAWSQPKSVMRRVAEQAEWVSPCHRAPLLVGGTGETQNESARIFLIALVFFAFGAVFGAFIGGTTPQTPTGDPCATCCEEYLDHVEKEHPEYAQGR
jgi:hypothetical protein